MSLIAVGRLKPGPERDLAARYVERAMLAGGSLGIAVASREIGESRQRRPDDRKRDEAGALRAQSANGGVTIVLDETGRPLTSVEFAAMIGAARDNARGTFDLVIGGPDGLDPDYRRAADARVSFGAMTWPHQLVRIMASEQIYRALTILSGHPYHRA